MSLLRPYFFLAALVCAAHPTYHVRAIVSPVVVDRDGASFRARAGVRFTASPRPALNSRVSDHARGHAIIAHDVLAAAQGTVEGVGRTASQARSRLLRTLAQMTSDTQRELDREEHVYDAVTEGGSAQHLGPQYGLPGGRDASDPCPKRA